MLRVGCGNSVRNHRPQWALSPASRFQVVQVARSGDGRLRCLQGRYADHQSGENGAAPGYQGQKIVFGTAR